MVVLSERIPLALGLALTSLAACSAECYAQSCDAGKNGTCRAQGAECSPIDPPFSGNQGICKTIGPKHELQCLCVPAPPPSTSSNNATVGNTLSAPIYVNLYWDATWDSDNPDMPKDALDDFTAALLRGSYFNGLAEYGVGSPSYAGGFLPHPSCERKAPNHAKFYASFDPTIIGFLQCELDNDHNVPQGSQVVYNIILPSGSLEDDGAVARLFGLDKFCLGGPKAWHFHQTPFSTEVQAAIILTGGVFTDLAVLVVLALVPGGPVYTISSADSRCGNFINNLAHEMVEAATDPFPPLSVILNGGTGEAVDICDDANAPASMPFVPPTSILSTKTGFPASRKFTTSSTISVPAFWSNANQTCVGLTGDTPAGRVTGGGTLPGRTALPIPNLPPLVTTSGNGATISFTISGQGFGALPSAITLPTSANLPYLAIQNNTQGWQAGNSLNGDSVNLNITSWSDTTITANGLIFSSGNNLVMKPNDNLTVWVCNPASGKCGATNFALQEPGTPELNLLVINSVPLHFNVLIDGKTVAAHTGGGVIGWQSLVPGGHLITEVPTDPGLFTPHFFGGCEAGKITLQTGDNQFCTVLNGFNPGCASGQHCCGSVGRFGCTPECVSNSVACNPLCPPNTNLNKCCEGPLATGECSVPCIKSPPQSCH
jgi:hypothetical protein